MSLFDTPKYPERELQWWDKPYAETNLHSHTPHAMEVIKMGSKIEQFVMTEKVTRQEIMLFGTQHGNLEKRVYDHLEHRMREYLSWYGLIIEDSIERIVELADPIDRDIILVRLKARALCPTEPFDAPDRPKRSFCGHCQSWSFEDKFHSGTCENCGAPFQRINS